MYTIRTLLETFEVATGSKPFIPRVYRGTQLYLQVSWSQAIGMQPDILSQEAVEKFICDFKSNKNKKKYSLFVYARIINPAMLGRDNFYEI